MGEGGAHPHAIDASEEQRRWGKGELSEEQRRCWKEDLSEEQRQRARRSISTTESFSVHLSVQPEISRKEEPSEEQRRRGSGLLPAGPRWQEAGLHRPSWAASSLRRREKLARLQNGLLNAT